MRIAITIPVYQNNLAHIDYLNQTTRSFNTTHELIFIAVINKRPASGLSPFVFTQEPTHTIIVEGRQPQAVSKAWNDGIAKGITEGCEYIIVLNQDVILGTQAIDELVTFAELNKGTNVLWTMCDVSMDNLNDTTAGADGGPHFSAFMVHKSFPEIMGKFDENIAPAYYEDNDMTVRIIKSEHTTARCVTAKFFHYGSITLHTDPEVQSGHGVRFMQNEAYFVKKWGNRVLHTFDGIRNQMYTHPFNNPNRDINDWHPDDRTGQIILDGSQGLSGTGLSPSAIQQSLDESLRANEELRKNQSR